LTRCTPRSCWSSACSLFRQHWCFTACPHSPSHSRGLGQSTTSPSWVVNSRPTPSQAPGRSCMLWVSWPFPPFGNTRGRFRVALSGCVSSPMSPYFRSQRASLQNVLAGALFSPALATFFLTTLTTLGSACATLLATPLAPFLAYLFPRALDMTRAALSGDSELDQDSLSTDASKNRSSAWVRLSVLRLIGVVPWSGINIACGVCSVPLSDCMLGSFIGCLPWTAVTCHVRLWVSIFKTASHELMASCVDWRYPSDSGFYSLPHSRIHLLHFNDTSYCHEACLPFLPLSCSYPCPRPSPHHDSPISPAPITR
jgi:uncharacterized membrane protein YdjX (TVP38/TMEM64 family)